MQFDFYMSERAGSCTIIIISVCIYSLARAIINYAYPINTSDSDDHYQLLLLIVAVSRLAVMYALKARNKLHKREKEGLKEKERESQQRTRDSDAHHHHEPARRTPSTAKREAKVK